MSGLAKFRVCALLVLLTPGVHAADAERAAPLAAATRQYTFAWPFADDNAMRPRGGTTKGQVVTLATTPRAEWHHLSEPALSAFERDRRAILAMAGEYRATFDFIEVAGFRDAFKPDRPFQSWGTEKVYVIADTGRAISLQHILVMNAIDKAGTLRGPLVTKHWRQNWTYEALERVVYRGRNRWQIVALPGVDRTGAWVQSVWQVDDSPRYSGVGRWQHFGNYSTWVSGEEWRPLPRREFSVRSDYHVLSGSNRHTITPTGWIQEELNLKVELDEAGNAVPNAPVLVREFGLNRYESIIDFDWTPADHYWTRTAPLWEAVRAEWATYIADGTIVLRGQPDQRQLFLPLFEFAGALEAGEAKSAGEIRAFVHTAVAAYLEAP